MKLTNKMNLPQAIYNAVKNDPYNKGESDFSVTELIAPAYQRSLMKKHYDELTEDVSDRLWSLYGQLMHSLLERANTNDLVEKRFYGKFGKYKISGQIDSLSLDTGVLRDFKFTTAYSFMANRPPKDEYVQQMNMQLELLRMNGHDAKKLEIIGLLRDWQIAKAKADKNYPNSQVAKHDIPIWTREETRAFIWSRIKAHTTKQTACLDSEIWQGRRCADYCSVNKFCTSYQRRSNGTAKAQSSSPRCR